MNLISPISFNVVILQSDKRNTKSDRFIPRGREFITPPWWNRFVKLIGPVVLVSLSFVIEGFEGLNQNANLLFWIFTAGIRRMGKVMFSVCPPLGGGGGGGEGYHSPRLFPRSLVPGLFQGGTLVPGSFQGLWFLVLSGGTPVPGGGYPSPGQGVPQSQWRGTPVLAGGTAQARTGVGYPPARTGVGYPPWSGQAWGTPPPLGTGYTVGGMPRAVSRRRTFLIVRG